MFLTETTFQLQIEELVSQGYTYIEAIVQFCEEHDLEFEEVKKLMTANLKGKLKLCAMEEGYIRKESTLPI